MKMYELNREQMEKLSKDSAKYLNSQEDIRTVLKDMYCNFFADKTEDIGYVMADKVLELVGEYHQDIRDAKADTDAWLERKVGAIVSGKTIPSDRCNALYQARISIIASEIYANEGKEAAESYLAEYEKKAFSEKEATEELENKLREELKDVIRNNTVLSGAMNAFSENIECGENSENATVEFGEEATEFKAVMVMQAYLQSGEDGYLSGVFPENTSLHSITYSVCSATDTMSVVQAVESGTISQKQGMDILTVIGRVIGAAICAWVTATVGIAVTGLLGTGILAAIGGFVFTWILTSFIIDTYMDAGVSVVNGIKRTVVFGTNFVISAGKKLINGVKNIVSGLKSRFGNKPKPGAGAGTYTVPKHDRTEIARQRPFAGQSARA